MNMRIKENLKKTFHFLIVFSLGTILLTSLMSSTNQDNTFFKFDSLLEGSEKANEFASKKIKEMKKIIGF